MVIGVGIPIKLLHEAQGLTVTLELKTGQVYRGKLYDVEDNMNVQLRDVIMTNRDGKATPMESVFLRGSAVRFFIVPDNLRHAPMLQPKTTAGISKTIPSAGLAGKSRSGPMARRSGGRSGERGKSLRSLTRLLIRCTCSLTVALTIVSFVR